MRVHEAPLRRCKGRAAASLAPVPFGYAGLNFHKRVALKIVRFGLVYNQAAVTLIKPLVDAGPADLTTQVLYLRALLNVSSPLQAAAAQSAATAFVAADFYLVMQHKLSSQGLCDDAQQWQKKGIDIWSKLAATNSYSAMRLHRAQAAPACPG